MAEGNGATGAGGPLAGLRVLDLSMIVAGGTASSLLADFGAEVVKVERPGAGDPLRNWGPFANGVSLWWKVHSRNKKSVTLDLGGAEGQGLLKGLAACADVLIEGFRPGVMERWGLGPEELQRGNPGLVVLRYSGFGQTGPYKDRPGFGTIAECMSGYVGMTGFRDTPPVLPPVPLADEVAGVFGAMSGMMALYYRDAGAGAGGAGRDGGGSGKGQVIDLSLFEPLFRLCIPHITMFDLLGINRERVGNDFPDAAPRSLYRTGASYIGDGVGDGKGDGEGDGGGDGGEGGGRWLGLSATSQSTFESLARAMGMPGLIDRPAFADNAARLENREELNAELGDWLSQRTLEEVLAQLIPAGGVVGPVYSVAEIVEDPHYRAREDIIEVDDPELGRTRMVGIVPKFSDTPGGVEHAGPSVGQHNAAVYGGWLGLGEADLAGLSARGVI